MKGYTPDSPMRGIKHPSEHDWTGQRSTFTGLLGESGLVTLDNGCVAPGDTRVWGTVVGQRYLGTAGVGLIPDFEIEVEGKSGAVVKIRLLDNNFQTVD